MSRESQEITRYSRWRRLSFAVLAGALLTMAVAACGAGDAASGGHTKSGGAPPGNRATTSGADPTERPFRPQQMTSKNWAGYVVKGRKFSSVSAEWVVPTARQSTPGHSAFWVGLGGASTKSPGLEQIGTDSDDVAGAARYYAWYEVLPAPSVLLKLTIHPGDHIAAKVTVNGTAVTMSLSDLTSGRSATQTQQVARPDTSSAEWIAEAPSVRTRLAGDRVLPLANFGKVTFTNAQASGGGHAGTITDADWRAQETRLQSTSALLIGLAHFVPEGIAVTSILVPTSGDAIPSAPTSHGSSFTVVWRPEL